VAPRSGVPTVLLVYAPSATDETIVDGWLADPE
jgi:hypothetical protein